MTAKETALELVERFSTIDNNNNIYSYDVACAKLSICELITELIHIREKGENMRFLDESL